jgi:predicted DNA binding CopG/RHH family protein
MGPIQEGRYLTIVFALQKNGTARVITGWDIGVNDRKEMSEMKIKSAKKQITDEEYYDKHGVLGEITDEKVTLSLNDALRQDILSGKRRRKLRNITIKLDPLYLVSIKKVATKKGIPYPTLVRQWVAENIRKELKIA